jgi:hypothetical protein
MSADVQLTISIIYVVMSADVQLTISILYVMV